MGPNPAYFFETILSMSSDGFRKRQEKTAPESVGPQARRCNKV